MLWEIKQYTKYTPRSFLALDIFFKMYIIKTYKSIFLFFSPHSPFLLEHKNTWNDYYIVVSDLKEESFNSSQNKSFSMTLACEAIHWLKSKITPELVIQTWIFPELQRLDQKPYIKGQYANTIKTNQTYLVTG